MLIKYTFEEVLNINNIRKSFVNIIFDLMKFMKIECYVYGGFVRDSIIIEQVQKNANNERLKQFICNKFSCTQKFDIDLAISKKSKKFYSLVDYLHKLISSQLILHSTNLKDNNTDTFVRKKMNNYYDSYYYTNSVSFEFMYDKIPFGIDFVNYTNNKIGPNDFWINNLAYDVDWNLRFKPGSFNKNFKKKKYFNKLADVLFDIINEKASPCNDFLVTMNRKYIKKNSNGLYEIINTCYLYDFISAYKRMEKMRLYGYNIQNIENMPKSININAICCDIPNTISFPKQYTCHKTVYCCINCKKLSYII